MWHDTNNENASAHRFSVYRINDEAAEDIDPQIPPMLPRGIVCEFTVEKMLGMAVILTVSSKRNLTQGTVCKVLKHLPKNELLVLRETRINSIFIHASGERSCTPIFVSVRLPTL